ncbi:DUF4214 domain-containing protein [Prochlorococcus sp. MIT 0916]|uniref:DUF4214 domain-containing protein n=1 Tax=Prochlorococcus marinus str. P0903-H212 TaxID=1622208 RepID=A0A0D5A3G9_PROMR|nr:hypothetical protein FA03_0127 [Prochlorococcus marinus str. P0903-H212]
MTLEIEALVSQSLKKHAARVMENDNDEKMTFYISDTSGLQSIKHYSINNLGNLEILSTITIDGIEHREIEKKFIRDTLNSLDTIIDIDFIEMFNDDGSELDIYYIKDASSFQVNVAGQTIPQQTSLGSWTDILWKKFNNNIDNSDHQNTLIHEIGHALGLSHPYEDPFNQNWNTDDTVMSYNKGVSGWNTWYTTQDIDALISIWGRENDDGKISLPKETKEYKFKKEDSVYYVKTNIGYEDISNINNIFFNDGELNVEKDIKNVFNLVQGVDHITGKIYRLYNAALGRFPDYQGYNYWIENYNSDLINFEGITQSFIASEEFSRIYGKKVSNESFINSLYSNVLNRLPDSDGFQYWYSQLNQMVDTRTDALIGFSESFENKLLFSNETNIYI